MIPLTSVREPAELSEFAAATPLPFEVPFDPEPEPVLDELPDAPSPAEPDDSPPLEPLLLDPDEPELPPELPPLLPELPRVERVLAVRFVAASNRGMLRAVTRQANARTKDVRAIRRIVDLGV